jgi:glyoxylase-like metal-dependent hydrolase (beta-lactamase superfamily II)
VEDRREPLYSRRVSAKSSERPRLRTRRRLAGGWLLQYELGPAANFAYLLLDAEGDRALAVDPAWEPLWLIEQVEKRGRRLAGVLLTHTHFDHMGGPGRRSRIAGVHELIEHVDVPVWVHQSEAERVARIAEVPWPSIVELADGASVVLGSLEIECLHTPGHTPGGCCFLVAGCLLSGDTLFAGNIGNVDHPAGDLDAMFASLRRLEALAPSTEVFPGHDYGWQPSSTIARELRLNAYMRPMKLEQWRVLMGRF